MAPPKSSPKDKKDTDKDEDLRMWAAVIFVVILFVVGLPLWWHVTTVERVDLPTSRIERLNNTLTYVRTNISIVTSDSKLTRKLVTELSETLQQETTPLLKFHISEGKLKAKNLVLSPEVLEATPSIHHQPPGVYQFILCPEMTSSKVLFGAHRTMYFSKNVDVRTLAAAITQNLLQESILVQAQEAITTPGYVIKPQQEEEAKENQRRVRLSSQFDLIFTVIVPDPDNVKVEWDFQAVTTGYIQPILDQLSSMSNYSIKSQWLYHVNLEQTPQNIKDVGYVISHQQMSHIVSTLENKLGSYASKSPCLHFILYVTECQYTPMFFINEEQLTSSSVISDRWGSIQIVNPSEANCKDGKVFEPEVHPAMSVFINELKQLLGVKHYNTMTNVDIVPYNAALLTDWEIDALFRIRTVEQIASSKLTLNSLIQLLDQISNIVITSQVGDAVSNAVLSAENTEAALDFADLSSGMLFSREAYNQSEFAFTHPSLLALLYFPDDQKYAVYIPLFLPVMIPVILSFHAIFNWIKKKIPANILQHIQLPCIPDQTQLYDEPAEEKED